MSRVEVEIVLGRIAAAAVCAVYGLLDPYLQAVFPVSDTEAKTN